MLARGFNKTAGEILKILQHTCGRYYRHMPGSAWKVIEACELLTLLSGAEQEYACSQKPKLSMIGHGHYMAGKVKHDWAWSLHGWVTIMC